jgi:2-oxoglutarate dehydrogenase E2 component (dihydrolipoamide succinyltransferase)
MELQVPPAGESISTVMISEWLVAEGDPVTVDQIVVVLETDKINVEVRSPVSGTLARILKQPGDEAEVGEAIAVLEEGAHLASASTPHPTPLPTAPTPAAPPSPEAPVVSPAARRVLDEAGVNPAEVKGTGKGGRVMKEDAVAHLEVKASPQAPASVPAPSAPVALAAELDGREEVVPMTPLRRKVAERLLAAQQTAAILTTFNEVDMSAVMDLRARYGEDFQAKHGVKLGFMSFFVKAAVEALKAYPEVNAEIRDQSIVYKNHYDIGVAVGGGKGLVVPVLREADRLSFAEVELGIKGLAKKAQEMKLSLADLEGGTFTISNGGVYGSMLSTPILNPPQSGILGLHNIVDRPVAVAGKVEIRPIMYLALSYDHRLIDGRGAVSFLVAVKKAIEDPARLLLEI